MKSKEQLLNMIPKKDSEKYQYLCRFFKYMPDIMAEEFHYVEIKKNKNIMLAGEPAESIYIVLEGDIKGIDYYETGSTYSFMDFSKMYILGDFELFSNQPNYIISIYAEQDCKLLGISADRYLNWIKHDENALFLRLNNALSALTCERKLDRNYLRMGCRERVISYLIKYYEKHEKATSRRITVSLTQTELSEKVGFNLRSVQRAVASLEAANLISIENRKMILSYEQYLKLIEEGGINNGKI